MIDRPLVAYGVISLILGVFAFTVIGPLSVLLLLFGPVFLALGLFAKAPEKPREEEPAPVEQPTNRLNVARPPKSKSWKEWLSQPIGAKKEATHPSQPEEPPKREAMPTKFCRECGAKIPGDSRYCKKCGAELGEGVSRETPRELTSGALPKTRRVKPGTIGLFMVLLVVIWAVSPVFVADPTPALVLTNTGVKGNFTLRLQNLTPWPITFRGWWIFTYPIQWMGTNGPAEVFTLPPFGAYIFEYYAIGGSETNSPVTFSGRVTLLYRSYPVSINSW